MANILSSDKMLNCSPLECCSRILRAPAAPEVLVKEIDNTRRGWCPRTGKGQRLMFKEAVSEYIWLATCQGKIYENKPPSATHETI